MKNPSVTIVAIIDKFTGQYEGGLMSSSSTSEDDKKRNKRYASRFPDYGTCRANAFFRVIGDNVLPFRRWIGGKKLVGKVVRK